MKVKDISKKIEPGFEPRTIQFTFETERELIAFYMIFNHSGIIRADGIYNVLDHNAITDALEPVDYNKGWEAFTESLKMYFK